MRWRVRMGDNFLGNVFGVLKLLNEFHSLFRQQPGEGFSPVIIWCAEGILWLIGVCMCRCSDQIVDHLLLHCNTSFELWSFTFQSFGIQWVLSRRPRRVMDLLFEWRNWFGKHDSRVWNLVPLCLMWTLWTERNSRTFEDTAITMDHLKGALVNSLFDWARVWGLMSTTLVTVFVVSLCSHYVSPSLM